MALGGSRTQGTARPDSDWDLAIYYRGHFEPEQLRALGWPGEVSELGGWGGGIYNGGAWLTVDGRSVDVHYRDLDEVDRIWSEARLGRFWTEPLLFHVAGIPSYLLLAELASNRTLSGDLPRPEFPPALRAGAPDQWWSRAQMIFGYASKNHAPHGRVTVCLGLIAEAVAVTAHAVLAAEGRWITNDKQLLYAAGLDDVDRLMLTPSDAAELPDLVQTVRSRCVERLVATGAEVSSLRR